MNTSTAQAAPLKLVPVLPCSQQQANFPRVLLIGDSISFGYAESVADDLRDRARFFRIEGRTTATVTGSLVLDTRSGLRNIESWLKEPWHIIHFNWGLHDIKMNAECQHAVPIDEYERNLEKLVALLRQSQAKLIWASTTPVPSGKLTPPRRHGDEIRYNQAAARVMSAHQIPIDDLYSAAQTAIQEHQPNEVQVAANVHFTPQGSQILAKSVKEMVLVEATRYPCSELRREVLEKPSASNDEDILKSEKRILTVGSSTLKV